MAFFLVLATWLLMAVALVFAMDACDRRHTREHPDPYRHPDCLTCHPR